MLSFVVDRFFYRTALSRFGVFGFVKEFRPVAQLAEQRSPKPQVGGSTPSWPAIHIGLGGATQALEKPILDKIKLLLAMVPLVAGIGAYYYFGDQPAWIRVIGLLVAGGISILIALQTELGRVAWAFRREAIIEVRKVVWPTRKETTQTTLVVLVVVIIMAILLWLLDMFLAWAVRFLTG